MKNFTKIVLTKDKCSDNINLQTKQQTTYKNLTMTRKLIDEVKRKREVKIGGLEVQANGTNQ